jgi:transposase InsO family protein
MSTWEVGAHCCAELLIPEVVTYIEALRSLDEWKHSDQAAKLLKQMSLGEMKRRIGALRLKHRIKGRTTTTASTIKRLVKVYAGPWRNRGPGHRQFDTVVHCGDLLKGDMVYTVNGVDPAILWSNRRAQWNKGETATLRSVEYIEKQIPSYTLSRHSDSGSEFLNYYFLEESERARIAQTRGRSGKKNDNAFIEERNGHIVRKWIGYERYDTPAHVDALNAVYEKLDLYLNHFQAVRRCIKRERVGAKYVRVYDTPQTPYARALAHKKISKAQKERLRAEHAALNPVTLLKEIVTLIGR